uniref:Zinc finger protein 800 isoform X1 n=2 Tax=Geotrypetes seraphini TaxID=260995 RepID=A0A6P8SFQ8_GEOSA|nr:zinc finger protein 800 isoform X1 [Geotrypetes seraphini]XP_033814601.1 zinc finger protein 800 isoform X1 [Geotrypetes seraphini]XP_033814602.1 zinc finger protein 800 isoform X1 [Geotrypetes seraphini]
MEKTYSTLRKTSHFLRNQHNNRNELDTEESRSRSQKMPLRDKCCQTDHHHHGCCEPARMPEPGDPPLLQQQLQTSKSGIQQIIECFRSGTKQLKHILLKEVDTIFECKSCRSLFRGLPNLITHKEFYCIPSLTMDDKQPTENDKQSQAIRDLLEAIYPRVDKQEYIVKLEPIETNQNAVFQFVSNVDNTEQNTERSETPDQGRVQILEPCNERSDSVLTPDTETVEPIPAENIRKEVSSTSASEEQQPQLLNPVSKSAESSDTDHQIVCRLCKKGFNCRRSIRRHIKRVHKKKVEEIKKHIEVQRKSNPSSPKGRHKNVYTASTCCDVCHKSFATKANVRRHIDEVHKGLRRDSVTPEISVKPRHLLLLKTVSPKKSVKILAHKQKPSSKIDYNLNTCKCPHCRRKYSSQMLLRKHVQIVHKTTLCRVDSRQEKRPNNATINTEMKVKMEIPSIMDSIESSTSLTHPPQNELRGIHPNEKKSIPAGQKNKVKQDGEPPKSSSSSVAAGQQKYKKPKLSAGFDFKQLYCKLCKRQFTSKQNLTKHIELHTDGNNIYVKFYRCPLCTYETRRKRDVIRHITVVHKRSSRSLAKITAGLESRAIKKPIEFVLNKATKRGPQRDEAKQIGLRQDGTTVSPTKKYEGSDMGIEVKVTKNFSLHRCNKCGKAFGKKTCLVHHKKTHKTSVSGSSEEFKTKGRSTRSKMLVW